MHDNKDNVKVSAYMQISFIYIMVTFNTKIYTHTDV